MSHHTFITLECKFWFTVPTQFLFLLIFSSPLPSSWKKKKIASFTSILSISFQFSTDWTLTILQGNRWFFCSTYPITYWLLAPVKCHISSLWEHAPIHITLLPLELEKEIKLQVLVKPQLFHWSFLVIWNVLPKCFSCVTLLSNRAAFVLFLVSLEPQFCWCTSEKWKWFPWSQQIMLG